MHANHLRGFSRTNSRSHGAALVIALSMVVLITMLVVAFFSRTTAQLQLSTTSASQSKTDLLAQGALTTIVADLRQEIIAGSTAVSPIVGVTNYYPVTNLTMVPSFSGTTLSTTVTNLVKRSAYNIPLFSGSYYGTTTSISRAANLSSTNVTLNGRSITPVRWNKHLLIPKLNPNDTSSTPVSGFTPPDWILVARNGTNPKTWSSDIRDVTLSNTSFVVGRYAYAIYDEGGLIDVNVAGYPKSMPVINTGYKNALSYADLTQLPGISSLSSSMQTTLLNALVGWRNAASTQAGGSFPNYSFTTTNYTNYYSHIASNPKGFLTASYDALNQNQSDRVFTSRQEFIKFLTEGLKPTASDKANLLNALQYLGTFSRDLNQPSFRPPYFYDSTAPYVVGDSSNGGNSSSGAHQSINPSYLGENNDNSRLRVTTPFLRNDGTTAIINEPLVKKRFALSRLAWLTYEGPSASASSATQNKLHAYGISNDIINQGTPANIKKYFGLTWNSSSNIWTYNHSPGGGNESIRSLKKVLEVNRDPDFIELLKSAINTGSIAKSATPLSNSTQPTQFAQQARIDTNTDFAILQIAANIIDQSDCDGYPTHITFNDGVDTITVHGVENLPYLYRMRACAIKVEEPSPVVYDDFTPVGATSGQSAPETLTNSTPNTLSNSGVGVLIQCPEIWNPHDWNSDSNKSAQVTGDPAPTDFRVVVESSGAYQFYSKSTEAARPSSIATTTLTPGFFVSSGLGFNPQYTLTAANSEMRFTTANHPELFREPTLLFRPNIPTGSGLSAPGLTQINNIYTPYMSGGGFKSVASIPDPGRLGDGAGQAYIGVFLGAFPLRWVNSDNLVRYVRQTTISSTYAPTSRLQYKDKSGSYVTYDEKTCNGFGHNDKLMTSSYAGFLNGTDRTSRTDCIDPRTSRFLFRTTTAFNGYGTMSYPPFNFQNGNPAQSSSITGWVNKTQGVLVSDRLDRAAGVGFYTDTPLNAYFLTYNTGWYPGAGHSGYYNPTSAVFRPGLLSQNNPQISNDGRLNETATPGAYSALSQYYADADGVVRRAMGAYVPSGGGSASALSLVGLPQAQANNSSYGRLAQSSSRPVVLNRPFRSVAELGYVFKGTPWKNLDFFTPESGDAPLLDVFCINDTDNKDGIVAGKVNLNTRQTCVLQAILAGTHQDEWNPDASNIITQTTAAAIAKLIVARTTNSTKGPLQNVSELVGKWSKKQTLSDAAAAFNIEGSRSYDGTSADLETVFTNATTPNQHNIQRYREAAVRALANVGTTRTWNLLIDVAAQTGHYSPTATAFTTGSQDNFLVEGEQRYWVHIAIDRLTGQIIDQQIEIVKE